MEIQKKDGRHKCKWKTNAKSCGQRSQWGVEDQGKITHSDSEHPECIGEQKKLKTSVKSCGQSTQETTGGREVETGVTSRGPEHPSIQGVLGHKRRKGGAKWEANLKLRARKESRVVRNDAGKNSGDKWRGRETSVKSCGAEHSKHPGCAGRQV